MNVVEIVLIALLALGLFLVFKWLDWLTKRLAWLAHVVVPPVTPSEVGSGPVPDRKPRVDRGRHHSPEWFAAKDLKRPPTARTLARRARALAGTRTDLT